MIQVSGAVSEPPSLSAASDPDYEKPSSPRLFSRRLSLALLPPHLLPRGFSQKGYLARYPQVLPISGLPRNSPAGLLISLQWNTRRWNLEKNVLKKVRTVQGAKVRLTSEC